MNMNRHWYKGFLALLAALALLTSAFAGAEQAPAEYELQLAAEGVSFNAAVLELDVGERYDLQPRVNVAGRVRYASSDAAVATVSRAGRVAALKAGVATITATVDGEVLARCAVTVNRAPTRVVLNKTRLTLTEGETFALEATLKPAGSSSRLTWKSSEKRVAKVSKKGVVTAVKAGKATITVKTANGKTATCKVTVKKANGAKYRALLVGEVHFDEPLIATGYDVENMARMLKTVNGAKGGAFQVTKKIDLSRDDLMKAIRTTFNGATANDVSLFYFSGHGDATDYLREYPQYARYAGALPLLPESDYNWVELWELADALKAIPGKVVVMIDACGSGAAVFSTYGEQNAATKGFDRAVVEAFSAADCGLAINAEGEVVGNADAVANVGEFRVANKFYVLTASRYAELSYCSETSSMFTGWLIEGVGTAGRMPADTDGNGKATLDELFRYVSKVGDRTPIRYYDEYGQIQVDYQHVQAYPKDSAFAVFAR